MRAYLQALILTGARREEMAQLRWEDVDRHAIWVKDKVKEEVSGLFQDMIILSYKTDIISHEEKERLKGKIKTVVKKLEKLYYDLLPIEGLLKEHTEYDFYLELMKLYQTTSLT